jgi:hypothetical protein
MRDRESSLSFIISLSTFDFIQTGETAGVCDLLTPSIEQSHPPIPLRSEAGI